MTGALAAAGVRAPRSAVILGAGATACSALAALRETGLRAVTVAVRDESRAAGLLAVAGRLGVEVRLWPLESAAAATAGQDLLISTVPAGAADEYARRSRPPDIPGAVFDVVYAAWPTALARAARSAGATVISGFELLLRQACGQFELMTGLRPAPLAAMRAAGQAELDRRSEHCPQP